MRDAIELLKQAVMERDGKVFISIPPTEEELESFCAQFEDAPFTCTPKPEEGVVEVRPRDE